MISPFLFITLLLPSLLPLYASRLHGSQAACGARMAPRAGCRRCFVGSGSPSRVTRAVPTGPGDMSEPPASPGCSCPRVSCVPWGCHLLRRFHTGLCFRGNGGHLKTNQSPSQVTWLHLTFGNISAGFAAFLDLTGAEGELQEQGKLLPFPLSRSRRRWAGAQPVQSSPRMWGIAELAGRDRTRTLQCPCLEAWEGRAWPRCGDT